MDLSTDFECGSGRLTNLKTDHWRLETVGDLFGYNRYFCARVDNSKSAQPRQLTLEILPDASLGSRSNLMTHFPSDLWYCWGDLMRWVPIRNTWEQSITFHENKIEIRIPVPAKTVLHLATNVPMRYSEMLSWIEQRRANISVTTIGKSFEGRDIPVLNLGTGGKRKILVLAGMHSSEHSGVWACRGIVDFLLTHIFDAREMVKHFDIALIPMLNPDGNVHGHSGASTQKLPHNNSLDFGGASEGKPPLYHENRLLWNWITEKFQPEVMLHFHGYMGWCRGANHPYDGLYVVRQPEKLFHDPAKIQLHTALMDRLKFETPAFSSHWPIAGELLHESLEPQLAVKFGTVSMLYEINTGSVGAGEQYRRGPQVLGAVARTLLHDLPI